MRKIRDYLVLHIREDFNARAYGALAMFLIASMAFNYITDFEDSYLDTLPDLSRLLAYFGWHILAYFTPIVILFYTGRHRALLNRDLYIRALLALFLLSLDRALPYAHKLIAQTAHPQSQYWWIKIAHNVSGVMLMVIPLLIYYAVADRTQGHFYGLRPQRFDARPYFIMLLIMMPVLLLASTLPGFQAQYPMYEKTAAASYWNVPEWFAALVYEVAYGINFIGIEFFYRGFLVLGMAHLLGRSSVLAMSVLYCFLHFGKPLPEAISSIFGGYILGVIALETKSIWGGIIVHIGIAWMMELIGALHKFNII